MTKKALLSEAVFGTFGHIPFRMTEALGIKMKKLIKKHIAIMPTKTESIF